LILLKKTESGFIFVNNYNSVFHNTPFGGIKSSGFGKDGGVEGFNDWSILKTIVMKSN